jgi:hypothetical protein
LATDAFPVVIVVVIPYDVLMQSTTVVNCLMPIDFKYCLNSYGFSSIGVDNSLVTCCFCSRFCDNFLGAPFVDITVSLLSPPAAYPATSTFSLAMGLSFASAMASSEVLNGATFLGDSSRSEQGDGFSTLYAPWILDSFL